MYATQPLQPLLAQEFNVSMTKASAFTAVIMFFLAIAPIIYGYLLERICAKKVLMQASLILCVTNIVLGFSNSYEMFFFARTIEALVIPAILTSTMTILANIDKNNISFNMSVYVASTVFGGLIGRVMSGAIATQFGWRSVFFSLSVTLLIGLFFISKLKFEGDAHLTKAKLNDVMNILKQKQFILIYALMFTMFFVFAGVLNILPFRMKELMPQTTEATIGLLYLGYGTGIIVSLYSKRIVQKIGSKINTILLGMLFYSVSLCFFYSSNMLFIFAMLFMVCVGMFTVHSVSTGLANSMKKDQKALTSGMYLTFYYIGGALGSIFPMMVYEYYGWDITLSIFLFLLGFILLAVYMSKDTFK
jgi:YNFM family putative membrane transporter